MPSTNSPVPTGRPRSLDDTKRAEICAFLANGCGLTDAARYVGCSIATIRREAHRNPEFAEKLRQAECDADLVPLNAIRHAARRSWRAGAWLMERADAERHGVKRSRQLTIAQLKKYNASLVEILKLKISDRMLCNSLTRMFNDVLSHCTYKIAAGRDPFPIPPEITGVDSWLPKPPTRTEPLPQSAPTFVPPASLTGDVLQ